MSSNETYYARWLAACCPDHPAICCCCNLCPKNRGLQERSVRRQKFASHSPTDAVEPRPVAYPALGARSGARAPDPARHRAAGACCSRAPSVNTSNPGMLRFCASSINPRRLRPSMSAAFWLRKEPPPNNLISRRCSDLVNSSQGIVGILMVPVR
jgi:hypothetical protein